MNPPGMPSDAVPGPASEVDDESADMADELEQSQRDNAALHDQLKHLVRTEHRLFRSQIELDRQLGRVRALSEFVLECPSIASAYDLMGGAAALLRSQFNVDHVDILEVECADPKGAQLRLRGDRRLDLPASEGRALLTATGPVIIGPSRSLVAPGAVHDFPVLLALLDDDETQQVAPATCEAVLMPIRDREHVGWVLVMRRREGTAASYFKAIPSEEHRPFLQLLVGHLERELEHGRLNADLRRKADELAESNDRLRHSLAELAETQHQLVHTSKMEALGRLAGGVAHDFNNLLTVVISTVQLLDDDARLSSIAHDDFDAIRQAATRAASLTRQLLTFGRRRPGAMERFALHPLLEEVSGLLRRLIGEDVTLSLQLDAPVDTLHADPSQIEQVVMNLVLNARDALGPGGTISISTSLGRPGVEAGTPEPEPEPDASVRAERADDASPAEAKPPRPMLVLTVADDGRGMDVETRTRVFEPFFTTKELGQGTGMGLATVYGVVQQLHGQVQVDSEVGQGARFSVYLPLAGEVEATEGADAVRATLLVVEDELAILRLVTRVLGDRGYRVIAAPSAEAALHRFTDEVDLVLTDVVMRGLDGMQLAEQLWKRRPGLPIVFMSGYPGGGRRGVQTDPSTFLPKPFTPDELMARIEQALARSASTPADAP